MELQAENLSKSYEKDKFALKDFTFSFNEGIYGLLGPNGAGKSTLINILTGNLKPTSGNVYFNDTPIDKLDSKYRNVLGFMPQQQNIYANFTLEHFLYYMAALKGMKRPEAKIRVLEASEKVKLSEHLNKKLGAFSGGMKQRALIAQVLLDSPKIIVMDEPTAGLDPKERIRVRNLIADISKGRIVLIATHVVPDIESIADNVIFLKHGQIAATGAPAELTGNHFNDGEGHFLEDVYLSLFDEDRN